MSHYNPLDPDTDPFRPPAVSTLVGCLHCGEEYDSYRIEWRIVLCTDKTEHGFWCCPIEGCDGRGFGFDIFPVDSMYQDERGGWVHDGGEESDEIDEDQWPFTDLEKPEGKSDDEDEPLPW